MHGHTISLPAQGSFYVIVPSFSCKSPSWRIRVIRMDIKDTKKTAIFIGESGVRSVRTWSVYT